MRILYLFILACVAFAGTAQNQKYIHQTFELDTATSLVLDLRGDFVVEKWVGSSIMVETRARLYDASADIFEHFLEAGRYEIESTLKNGALTLSSKDKVRAPIKTTKGVCREEVQVRIFIPEDLEQSSSNTWTLPETEIPEGMTKKGEGG